MTNCKNCAAPLKNGKCEYCGTEYSCHDEEVTLYADNIPVVTLYHNSLLTPNEARKLIFKEK